MNPINRLRVIARHNPASLTSAQKDLLVAAANFQREEKADLGLPFANSDASFDIEVLRHPSGILVHGPGSADSLRAIMGRTLAEGNSAVWATLMSYGRAYKEPQLRLWKGPYLDIEGSQSVDRHPVFTLLRQPNPWIKSLRALSEWLATVKIAGGNSYLVKVRAGGGDITTNTTGAVQRLMPLSPLQMWPMRRKGSGNLIDYYAYRTGRAQPFEVPPENVIHFRNGLDPKDPAGGIGIVKLLASEVATEEQASRLTLAVLSNLGVPGLIVSPKNDQGMIDDPTEMKEDITARTTGDRRGEAIVLTGPVDIQQFQSNLEILKLDQIWKHVETRISGLIGWPAILAGLEAGLEHATYANAEALQEFATEQTLISVWFDDSETWTNGLGADFGLDDGMYLAYDWPKVRALQEDEDKRFERANKAWDSYVITLGQWHTMVGKPLPEGADPNARKADMEGLAKFGLGPGIAKAGPLLGMPPVTLTLGADAVRALFAKSAEDAPDRTLWKPVHASTAAGLTKVGDLRDLADEADADWSIWAKKAAPEYSDILSAKTKAAWTWDAQSQQYVDSRKQRLPYEKVRALLLLRQASARDELRQMAGDFTEDQSADLAAFQKLSKERLMLLHIQSRALAVGGLASMTDDDWDETGERVKGEMGYLEGFGKDVSEGRHSPAGIIDRLAKYVGSAFIGTFVAGRLLSHKTAGFTKKRRIGPNDDESCATCSDEISKGYVDIDEKGWEIGHTDCMSDDRCDIEFGRDDEGDTEE